jgi:hypothetical protein
MTFRILTYRTACFFTALPLSLLATVFGTVGNALADISDLITVMWLYAFVGGECPCTECKAERGESAEASAPRKHLSADDTDDTDFLA